MQCILYLQCFYIKNNSKQGINNLTKVSCDSTFISEIRDNNVNTIYYFILFCTMLFMCYIIHKYHVYFCAQIPPYIN